MNLESIYKKFSISFEIFPPKTDMGTENLFTELENLSKFNPAFISVTYGAGGSTREKTLDIALRIKNQFEIMPLIHFTCVGSSRSEIATYLDKVKSLGLNNILALRGDPPAGDTEFKPAIDGFSFANELVKFIKSIGEFNIAVAAYPNKHPEAMDLKTDIDHLKRKVDDGAEIIITQLFFDNNDFFSFVEKTKKVGIDVPIIPGIMPIVSTAQIDRISQMGAAMPSELAKQIKSLSDPNDVLNLGIDYATKQCDEIIKNGFKGIHFYPMNKAYSCNKIITNLGI